MATNTIIGTRTWVRLSRAWPARVQQRRVVRRERRRQGVSGQNGSALPGWRVLKGLQNHLRRNVERRHGRSVDVIVLIAANEKVPRTGRFGIISW